MRRIHRSSSCRMGLVELLDSKKVTPFFSGGELSRESWFMRGVPYHSKNDGFGPTCRRTLVVEVPFLAKFLPLPRSATFFEAGKNRKLARDSCRRIVCSKSAARPGRSQALYHRETVIVSRSQPAH